MLHKQLSLSVDKKSLYYAGSQSINYFGPAIGPIRQSP